MLQTLKTSPFARALLFLLALLSSGPAEAARHRVHGRKTHGRANMPPGWTWPPSEAMRADGRACLKRLDELGIGYRRVAPTSKITTPIELTTMEIGGVTLTSIWRKGPHLMDCQLARAFAERGAAALKAAGVAALRFSSIHAARNVAGTRILSRHALGLAMDVYEVVTTEGTTLVVQRDYPHDVLIETERRINESGVFRYLLTPGNDRRRHRDHFHFEARSTEEVGPGLAGTR